MILRHTGCGSRWLGGLIAGVVLVFPGMVSGQVVESLGVIPNPFSPNGDGVMDRAAISCRVLEDLDSLSVVVEGEGGGETWRAASEDLVAGWYEWEWDGRTSAGTTFADGVHRATVFAYRDGAVVDSSEVLLSTDTVSPRVWDFRQVRSSFAPDADLWNMTAVCFSLDAGWPAADTTRVRILDRSGTPLVSLGGFGGSVEDTTFSWGGRDSAGTLMGEGLYVFEVRAADEAGNADLQAGHVYLDRAAPSVGAYADTLFTVAFPETLTGWSADPSGVAAVELRPEDGDWADLQVVGGDSVVWESPYGQPSDEDGWYALFARARDVFGHQSDSVRIVIGKAGVPPSHVETVVEGDGVFANGDGVRIETEWDAPGYVVEADFGQVDSGYSPRAESVEDLEDGRYLITYVISGSNSIDNAEDLAIVIRATRVYRSDSVTVYVELQNEEPELPEPGRLALDRNVFDPEDGQVLQIEFPTGAGGSRIDIYTLMGERVWSRNVGGMTSVTWDGRNGAREVVASGVYLIRLGDEVRKVGVVK